MLVLSRKVHEAVVVGGAGPPDGLLKVTVLAIQGSRVKLGFEVAMEVAVHRFEVWQRISGLSEFPSSERTANRTAGANRLP